MTLIEHPLPPLPPEARPPVLIAYDEVTPLGGAYINALIWYAHLAAIGQREPGTTVERSKRDPSEFLVLLPGPVTGICTATGRTITFTAAVLREFEGGIIDGWLCDDQQVAQLVLASPPEES